MHVVGAFIGVDHFQVHQVPCDAEFVTEWRNLGDFLQRCGGIEEIIRRLYVVAESNPKSFTRPKRKSSD